MFWLGYTIEGSSFGKRTM